MKLYPPPYPRLRLYTTPRSYGAFLGDSVLGCLTRGDDVQRLESAWCERFGVAHALAVPMARVGIYLALRALIRPGQRVILSPYTIADVVNMVILAGGIPAFADLEPDSCNIDPTQVAARLGPETGAVLVTHLHGCAARVAEIRRLCDRYSVPLIEDTAQALGAAEHGTLLGTLGDAGVYSLGMYKNVNAWYGGMVVSPHGNLIARMRAERDTWAPQSFAFLAKRILRGLMTDSVTFPPLFRALTFWVLRLGVLHDLRAINRCVQPELDARLKEVMPDRYLRQMTPFQARLILRQLDGVAAANARRRRAAQVYRAGLDDIPGLILPPQRPEAENTYMAFPVQVEHRARLLKWLAANGRDVAAQHLKNCADLPSFARFGPECPIARRTAAECVLLPTYPRYPLSEVYRNVDALRKYCAEHPSARDIPRPSLARVPKSTQDLLGRLLSRWRNNVVAQVVRPPVLDVACGLNLLARRFPNGVGIDIQDHGDTDVVVEDFRRLPFDDGAFRTVTIIASLNYFSDPAGVLQECARILQDDGQIVITVLDPRVGRWWHRVREPWARRPGVADVELRALVRPPGRVRTPAVHAGAQRTTSSASGPPGPRRR